MERKSKSKADKSSEKKQNKKKASTARASTARASTAEDSTTAPSTASTSELSTLEASTEKASSKGDQSTIIAEIYKEANNLFNRDKFSEALKKLEESTALPTEALDFWILKARCYNKLKRHEDAFQAAQAIFKVGTKNVGIVNTLGEGYFRNGDYDSASRMFLLACDAVESEGDKVYFESRSKEAIKKKKKQEKKQNKKKASTARASTAEVPEASTSVLSTLEASTEKASSKEKKKASGARASASTAEVSEVSSTEKASPEKVSSLEVADTRNCCLNVLFVGHAGAGKTTAIRKLLQNHLDNVRKSVDRRLIRHLAHTDTSEAQCAKDNQIKFGLQIDTETTRFNILDMPSSFDFVSKLMYKASQADIAVLFTTGCAKELNDLETLRQTQQWICLVTALSIPNIVVVVNKIDDPSYVTESFQDFCKIIEIYVKDLKSDTTKVVKCLPISGKKDLNMYTQLKEDECTWWNGPCLLDVLEAIVVPMRSFSLCKSNQVDLPSMKKLIEIDFKLETTPKDSTFSLWFERAKLLGILRRFPEACHAALKASENPCDDSLYKDAHAFSLLIQGHQYRAKEEFKKALGCYSSAKASFCDYNNDSIMEIMRDIIDNTFKEQDEKKKKAEEDKKSSVASQNKEDEAEKSEVREDSRQKLSKKQEKQNEKKAFTLRASTAEDSSATKVSSVSEASTIVPSTLETSTEGAKVEVSTDTPEVKIKNRAEEFGESAKEESIEVVKKDAGTFPLLKFSVALDFHVHKHLHGDVYEGEVSCAFGKVPKTFISVLAALPTEVLNDNIIKLQKLASEEESILKIDHYVENTKFGSFLVVDQVYPLDHFFKSWLEKFRSTITIDEIDRLKKAWWKMIEDDFTRIFRDVVHGLMSLYSVGRHCGQLKFSIYVTKEKRGKILPTLDVSGKTVNKGLQDDINDLKEKMQSILVLPFSFSRFNTVADLSPELDNLLSCLHLHTVTCAPAFWIVNHPFFWQWAERVAFIKKIKYLLKINALHRIQLDMKLNTRTFFSDCRRQNLFWDSSIGPGVFREVFEKPARSNKVQKYKSDIDIVRYMSACYAHVNDLEYISSRGNMFYSEVDIESFLRNIFPSIYVDLHESLYSYAGGFLNTEVEEVFLNLSSCCYIKKEFYRTL